MELVHCGICESCHLKCYLLIVNYTSQKTEQQRNFSFHYSDDIMGEMASQITSLAIVYSTVYSGADQRKHQSSASLAFVLGIPRGPVNSPHKWPVSHWGRVTHICVSEIIITGPDNGLSPGRRQAIIWTNAGILLIGPLRINFNEILIGSIHFHSRKCIWKCRLRNGAYFVSASMW